MPTADIPGWQQTFSDDFNGTAIDSRQWWIYDGVPGGDPGTFFAPSHVTASSGTLVISDYQDPAYGNKWTTGGIQYKAAQTYGKYLVRFRFDAGPGLSHALILWPPDDSWPPEIDFSEDNSHDQ